MQSAGVEQNKYNFVWDESLQQLLLKNCMIEFDLDF